jgi:hypothetical protein
MERERFLKLLGMTSSSNDGEALAAIRKCNALLAQHKLSWYDVVQQCPSPKKAEPAREAEGSRSAPDRRTHASPSRAFEASIQREQYLDRIARYGKMARMRAAIQRVPILLRVLFFPLWAGALMVAVTIIPEASRPASALKVVGVILVVLACSAVWVATLQGIIGTLSYFL